MKNVSVHRTIGLTPVVNGELLTKIEEILLKFQDGKRSIGEVCAWVRGTIICRSDDSSKVMVQDTLVKELIDKEISLHTIWRILEKNGWENETSTIGRILKKLDDYKDAR